MQASHVEAVSIHHPTCTVAPQDLHVISASDVSLSVLPCHYTGYKCQFPSEGVLTWTLRCSLEIRLPPLWNMRLLFIDLVSPVTLSSAQTFI